MFDSSALQAVCTGECSNGTAGAFAAVSTGCVIARTGAGTYTVTLNGQAGSEHVSAAASRVIANATTALQGVSAVKTADNIITVTTWVGAGGVNVATDGTFDITVFRDPTITT